MPCATLKVVENLRAHHLMTKHVVTLHKEQSLPLADSMMELNHVRHLPVVDGRGRLVGLVTHRDVLAAQISTLAALSVHERNELQLAVPVARLMNTLVWTVRPDTPAVAVAELLMDNRFGCVPVVDDHRKVVGIVTEADFLSLAVRMLEHAEAATVADMMTADPVTVRDNHTLRVADELLSIGCFRHLPVVDEDQGVIGLVTHRNLLAAQYSTLTAGDHQVPSVRIGDIMETDVWTIAPDASQLIAARTLRDHRFGCLPVVEDGRIVGIVTEADFLSLIVDTLDEAHRRPSPDAPVNYYATRPARCLGPFEDLDRAQQVMVDYGVSTVGVTYDGELVGVLSRSDLFRIAQRPYTPKFRPRLLKLPTRHVDELMSRKVRTVHSYDSVTEAARRMVADGIHHLFVVEGKIPIGVFSTTDMMRVVRDLEINRPVSDYMSRSVFTIDSGESVSVGMQMLERSDLTGLVVTHDGWPVGCFGQRSALEARDLAADTPIDRLMSQRIVTLPAKTPLFLAAGQAAALRVCRIVVMDGAVIVGILSGLDFARACADYR